MGDALTGTTAPTWHRYLECFDSVRLSRPDLAAGRGAVYPLETEAAELQVFLEVLLTLAMGRTIVVPQSYAFDSWAFVHAAKMVLEAKDATRSQDRPFRVRLFGSGVRTYRGAVDLMLSRVNDQQSPFVSSLLPELEHVDPGELQAMRGDRDYLWSWADEQHTGLGPLMQRIDAEFRAVSAVRSQPTAAPPTLAQRLHSLSTVDADRRNAGSDPHVEHVQATVVGALARLDTGRPGAFGQRSRLRQNLPWPNDAEGRTPEEIVGGPRVLDLVVELVDTLYNRVVVDSIGGVEASFVTTVGTNAQQQLARATAQRMALPGGASLRVPDDSAVAAPSFELLAATEVRDASEKTRRDIRVLFDSATTALEGLMDLRGAAGSRADGLNPFWASVQAMEVAARENRGSSASKAIEKHLELVAGALNDKAHLGFEDRLATRLSLSIAGTAASSLAEAHLRLPPGSLAGLGALAGQTASDLLPELPGAAAPLVRRSRRRRLASALNELVHVPVGSPA
jgi:hypothetical protein